MELANQYLFYLFTDRKFNILLHCLRNIFSEKFSTPDNPNHLKLKIYYFFAGATAEVILSRGIMLWVGARGTEFSWIYILKCLESNVLLVQHITTATLIWLFTRHDLNKALKPLVSLLLAVTVFKGVWLEGMLHILTLGPWLTVAVKALVAAIIGFCTLHIYSGLAQQIGI